MRPRPPKPNRIRALTAESYTVSIGKTGFKVFDFGFAGQPKPWDGINGK
jgi:hypothetical protein